MASKFFSPSAHFASNLHCHTSSCINLVTTFSYIQKDLHGIRMLKAVHGRPMYVQPDGMMMDSFYLNCEP